MTALRFELMSQRQKVSGYQLSHRGDRLIILVFVTLTSQRQKVSGYQLSHRGDRLIILVFVTLRTIITIEKGWGTKGLLVKR